MGASSGNTRSRLCFVFPPCTCTLSVSQSPSQARKQAISAHTILYVQYTQERTHARTHIRADSTHTISYCTTQHHSLFFPHHLDLCSALSSPLSFHFFFIPVVLSFNPLHLYNDCFSEFLGLISPISYLLLAFVVFEFVLSPSSHSLSSLTLLFLSRLATFAQMRDDSQQSGNLGNYAAVSE